MCFCLLFWILTLPNTLGCHLQKRQALVVLFYLGFNPKFPRLPLPDWSFPLCPILFSALFFPLWGHKGSGHCTRCSLYCSTLKGKLHNLFFYITAILIWHSKQATHPCWPVWDLLTLNSLGILVQSSSVFGVFHTKLAPARALLLSLNIYTNIAPSYWSRNFQNTFSLL